jgi:hypothetical protein
MHNFFSKQKMTRFSTEFLLAAALVLLAACSNNTGGTGSSTTGGTATPPVAEPTISMVLTDVASGGIVTSVSSGAPANVNATVKDATGAAVPNVVVTFSTDTTMATINPTSGTALTNGSGVATVTLTGGANAGATTIIAKAQVPTATAAVAASGSIGYSVGATSVTISKPVFGVDPNPLSAFGTTSITATVTGGGSGSQIVNFSSGCSGSGKAILSTGITTVGGIATGSYRDSGCASTDTITATVNGGLATSSATLVVTPPTAGSIKYISSLPTNLSLQGTGGQEVSVVTFMVQDTGGNPIGGRDVSFGLSTTAGGITLTPATGTATSDAQGLVQVNVRAGVKSTSVRVTATGCSTKTKPCTGTVLTTQSNQLTITTGITDQFGTSLSASTHNIEGWSVDGTKSVLTVSLADHFKNPVPDGTAVVFTSEGAVVDGQCTTVAGSCSATFKSQNGRPDNGRVTVLASAQGEETFTDINSSGWADLLPTNEMIDPNSKSTDLPEAFVDYNENGQFDSNNEPYMDFNHNGIYDPADGKYNGVLCDDVTVGRSSSGTCGISHYVDVRASQVIVLSSSSPAPITFQKVDLGVVTTIDPATQNVSLQACTAGGATSTLVVMVVDINGNAMPAGTKVEFSTSNGLIRSATSVIVPDTIGCRNGFVGCPSSVGTSNFGDIPVVLQTDATAPSCTNNTSSGIFTVKITSPNGLISYATVGVND